jgi:uncharacterized protein YcbK (DUF882 family)
MMMSKVSKHFDRKEFRCQCGECVCDAVDVKLLEVVEAVRCHFDLPLTITSANRCRSHNIAVGGKPKSYHRLSKAADIQVKGISPDAVASYLDTKYPDKYGLGRYDKFTHIDVRDTKARWDNRS